MAAPGHLATYDALLAASGESPYIRYAVGARGVAAARAVPGGVAVPRTTHTGRQSWTLLGDARAVGELLGQAPFQGAEAARLPFSLTLARTCLPLLDQGFRITAGDDWDWMWTLTSPPASPRAHAEQRDVIPLAGRDASAVARFLERHSPRASTQPGGDHDWFGIHDASGDLVAIGALGTTSAGAGHLSSVAVDEHRRGEGLGARITAELTRIAVQRCGACTLGLYADNAPARALYRSVGYDGPLEWSTRIVTRR
ncbi:MAG TPA: GNAT family N-acetyltransferase [Candidatus Lustribacter sp.]|nr:GNAT family N-acetyltransferase [Candidatus Lustribacter sp.]